MALKKLGKNEKNPTLCQLFSLLEKNEQVTFNYFIKAIYEKLGRIFTKKYLWENFGEIGEMVKFWRK